MSTEQASLSHHPAPHRERVAALENAFGLLGGPAAWFVQLCVGFALSTWPCFPSDQRFGSPLPLYAWTGGAAIAISLAAVVVALIAAWVSWRIFRRTRAEAAGDRSHLIEVGTGRTRFLALWGVAASGGFAVATAFTAVALFMLPRCAG